MSIPTSSRALSVAEKGGPVKLVTLPTPTPAENEVLVQVTTAALNPHDALVQRTGLLIPSFPFIPAADIGGKVVKLGPGVTRFAVGDEIFAQVNWTASDVSQFAGLREYTLVDVRSAAKVSEIGAGNGLDATDDAVTIPTNAVAAVWGFLDKTGYNLPPSILFGESEKDRKSEFDASKHDLVLIGGGSRVGKLAVQVAKVIGWRNIVVVGGNEDELKKWGATHVVDRHGDNEKIIKQIRDIVGDDLKYAYNAVSHDYTIGVGVLSNTVEGHLNSLTSGETNDALIGEKKAGYKKTLSSGLSLNNHGLAKFFWDKVGEWVKSGVLVVPKWTKIDGLDAEKIQEVLDKYYQGKAVLDHTHIHL